MYAALVLKVLYNKVYYYYCDLKCVFCYKHTLLYVEKVDSVFTSSHRQPVCKSCVIDNSDIVHSMTLCKKESTGSIVLSSFSHINSLFHGSLMSLGQKSCGLFFSPLRFKLTGDCLCLQEKFI